jgi:putative ABC transport system permease protein
VEPSRGVHERHASTVRLLRRISLRQLRVSWARTLLVVIGIATGVALIVAIDLVNASVLTNFRKSLALISGPASLEVVLGVGEIGFVQGSADVVATDPDVIAAVPLVRGTVSLADGASDEVELFGVDLTAEDELARYGTRLASDDGDMLVWLNDPHSIAFNAQFAEAHAIAVGDRVRLSTRRGIEPFTVRGLLEPHGLARAFGGQIAVMDLPAAQLLLGKVGLVDQVDVVLRDGADPETVRDRLQPRLPPGLNVRRTSQRGALYESVIGSFQAMLTGLSLLCLVAGLYIVYNTTATGAIHRGLGMASLQVAGANPDRLFRLLMVEALILGVVGTGIGLPAGIILAQALTGLVSDSMGVIFQLRFRVDGIAVDGARLLMVGALGAIASLLASYFATRQIIELSPLEVLSVGPHTIAGKPAPLRFVALWAVMAVATVAALLLEVRYKSAAWGNIASTVWFASSIVLAVPVLSLAHLFFPRILTLVAGPAGRVAAESLFRSTRRTGVTIGAITLVVTVAVTISSVARSQRESVKSYFVDGFLASDLAVSAVATEGGWLESPIPAALASELESVDGVRTVETIRIMPGQLYGDERIAIAGLSDGLFDPHRYPSTWYRSGDAATAARAIVTGRGANVSLSFADRFDVSVGDRIEIASPTGPVPFVVVGIVPDYVSDKGIVIFSANVLAERWNDSLVNRLHVFLRPGVQLEDVRARIVERFRDRYRLKVLSLQEGVTYLARKIDEAFAFTTAIQLLIVVVTVAGIFDLLMAGVWERRRELSVWRVVGAAERLVRRSIIIESAIIGALGSGLGIVVGWVTSLMWVRVNYRYILGYYLDFHFAAGAAVLSVALVISMAVLAGYLAARHATRHSILEGIQSS